MQRFTAPLKILLILLGLSAAVIAPVVWQGNIDLRHAQFSFNQNDFENAARDYESAARRIWWRSDLWQQAGLSYESAKDIDNALRLFETARKYDALSAKGWDLYGTAYWISGKDEQALEIWMAGLKEYPLDTEFYSRFALAYRNLNNFRAEQNALEIWLATGNGTALEHYELGQLLMTSDPQRALQELLMASQLDPQFSSVVQTLKTSLDLAALDPTPARRLIIIGRGLGLTEEWGLASRAFEQAVKIDSTNAEAWAWLGEAQQHKDQDGILELDKALSLDSGDPVVLALRGLYWKRHGNYTNSLAEYQKAALIDPNNPTWQISLGESFTLNGDLVSALNAYQKATMLKPNDAVYWSLLAMFCADNDVRVSDIGLPAAQKAAELAPADPQVLDALGFSFLKAGYIYNAEQNLLKSVKIAPGSAQAHLHLAETYLQKADRTSAFNELKITSQLDGSGPIGQLADQLLKQYYP